MEDRFRIEQAGRDAKIHWLMIGRLAIITFLLGLAVFSETRNVELIPRQSLSSYYIIVVVTYALSLFYLLLFSLVKNVTCNIYLQSLCDTVLVTYMVYATGGTNSIYSVFYTLIIIYCALFLGRGGSLFIASVCSIAYGMLLDLEYYKLIYPFYTVPGDDSSLAGYVFARIFTHILSFYLIAYLASFVVEQEKRLRILLAEKEDAFEQLDVLHRSIVESVSLGILTVNSTGRIKSFNRAAEEITDYTFPEVLDRKLADILPISADLENMKKSSSVPAENRFEILIRTAKGRSVILGCSLSVLKTADGIKIGDILIFQDLTSIKKIEESYEKSRRMAFIGEMAARLAHEIRNPLASISGCIQILGKDMQLSESDKKLLNIILRGKDQLEGFLKDFLLLARPAPGPPEFIDVDEVIENIIDSLQCTPAWHDGIRIIKKLGTTPPLYINRTDLWHILWNLILNASQAMPQGGMLQIRTEKDTKLDNSLSDCLRIVISDTGCGIEESNISNIFEPFFTTKEQGTGLGLAIVNRVVSYNRGKIEINSDIGKGTECSVYLPYGTGNGCDGGLPGL